LFPDGPLRVSAIGLAADVQQHIFDDIVSFKADTPRSWKLGGAIHPRVFLAVRSSCRVQARTF